MNSIEAHVSSPRSSRAKFQQNANTYGINPMCDVLMRHMPYIYTSGEMSQVLNNIIILMQIQSNINPTNYDIQFAG